jgi:hypothetical protein
MKRCPYCQAALWNHERSCKQCGEKTIPPAPAREVESGSLCSDLVAELEAVQTQLEDAWTALCKQDWGAATQNVFDVRASVTKLVESVRGHSATAAGQRQAPAQSQKPTENPKT